MAKCNLWVPIPQRGPRQFCDRVWGNIADNSDTDFEQPDGVVTHQHETWAGFANENLSVVRYLNRGRGIRTQGVLEPETQVFNATPFAAAVRRHRRNNLLYCVTCHRTRMKSYVTCPECDITSYCSLRCQDSHQTHHLECGSRFEFIEDLQMKCTIQMVLEAITMYTSIDELKTDIQRMMNGDRDEFAAQVPIGVNDRHSRLRCILQLYIGSTITDEMKTTAQHAYRILISLPKINAMVRERRGIKRFLKHLVSNFYYIVIENGFNVDLKAKNYNNRGGLVDVGRVLIYDVISFANHSCVPNVRTQIVGNVFVGITNFRIRQEREITISYIHTITKGANRQYVFKNRAVRRRLLRNYWHFRCKCRLCKIPNADTIGALDILREVRDELPTLTRLKQRLSEEYFRLSNIFQNCVILLWYIFKREEEVKKNL